MQYRVYKHCGQALWYPRVGHCMHDCCGVGHRCCVVATQARSGSSTDSLEQELNRPVLSKSIVLVQKLALDLVLVLSSTRHYGGSRHPPTATSCTTAFVRACIQMVSLDAESFGLLEPKSKGYVWRRRDRLVHLCSIRLHVLKTCSPGNSSCSARGMKSSCSRFRLAIRHCMRSVSIYATVSLLEAYLLTPAAGHSPCFRACLDSGFCATGQDHEAFYAWRL